MTEYELTWYDKYYNTNINYDNKIINELLNKLNTIISEKTNIIIPEETNITMEQLKNENKLLRDLFKDINDYFKTVLSTMPTPNAIDEFNKLFS